SVRIRLCGPALIVGSIAATGCAPSTGAVWRSGEWQAAAERIPQRSGAIARHPRDVQSGEITIPPLNRDGVFPGGPFHDLGALSPRRELQERALPSPEIDVYVTPVQA